MPRFQGIPVEEETTPRFGGELIAPAEPMQAPEPEPVSPFAGFENAYKSTMDLIHSYLPESVTQVPKTMIGAIAPALQPVLEPGKFEAKARFGSQMVAEPAAGIAGIAGTVYGGPEMGEQAIEATREALTYPMQTEMGRQELERQQVAMAESPAVQYAAQELAGMQKGAGELGYQVAGPIGGAIGEALPAAAIELLGLKGLRSIRPGTILIDEAGQPTKALRKALDKQGLTYEGLTPEARSQIPQIADPSLLPGGGKEIMKGISEDAVKEQIKAGGRESALAPFRVSGDEVIIDAPARAAMRQGWEDNLVQLVKTSSIETKFKMMKMLERMRAIKKNLREARYRPADIVGDALLERVNFIKGKADKARLDLDRIAKTRLAGKPINLDQVRNKLYDELDNLNIQYSREGKPNPVYTGSQIAKDRTSQRIINDVIDLMGEGGRPDALRAHNLKRQLDALIDFKKKSATGLTDAGRNVMKSIRHELNQVIRGVDTKYAEVNDILSRSLGAFDELQGAVGKKIDIFGETSNSILGQEMRKLTSNYKSRYAIEEALRNIDNTTKDLGKVFKDDLYDLNNFANALDTKFGPVAETGFQSLVGKGVESALERGMKGAAVKGVAAGTKKAYGKVAGINDFNAFETMYDLLKRVK